MPEINVLDMTIDALEDLKGTNIETLNVTELTDFTDHMVVCTGRSSRHIKALAESVAEKAKANKMEILSVTGTEKAEWVLVDLGQVIVHVMLENIRELYDLESLWSETPATKDAD